MSEANLQLVAILTRAIPANDMKTEVIVHVVSDNETVADVWRWASEWASGCAMISLEIGVAR